MKVSLLLTTLMATLGLVACNPASTPTPVEMSLPSPAAAPGYDTGTGTTGVSADTLETERSGKTGDSTVVVPAQK